MVGDQEHVDNVKQFESKPQWDLVHMPSLAPLVRAMEYGAKKYAKHNWMAGQRYSVYYNAAFRHLTAWFAGETNDPDSGVSHLGHVLACVMILIFYQQYGRGEDDRHEPIH